MAGCAVFVPPKRYRILEPLGQGGMAEVYKAEDLELGRTVALKLLRPEWCQGADEPSRLIDEARAAARLNHPHIATRYDLAHEDGVACLVMEYVDGETLAHERYASAAALCSDLERVRTHRLPVVESGLALVLRDLTGTVRNLGGFLTTGCAAWHYACSTGRGLCPRRVNEEP